MEIWIRQYKSSDYNPLLKLLNKEYGTKVAQGVLEEKYITNDRNILVATTNDNVLVGCTFTEIQQDYIRSSRIMYVTYVAVDENYRKHGIGRKLLNHVEDMCNELNCSAIELTSANFRTEAHAFYNAIEFTKKRTTIFIKEVL